MQRMLTRMPSETLMSPDFYRRTDLEMMVDHCPNCDGPSKLKRNDYRIIWPLIMDNRAPPFTPYVMEEAWTCVVCDKTMIRILIFGQGDEQDRQPIETRLIYPDRAPRILSPEAPESVASLFREASLAENAGALRGAAGLYRAAAEALVKDQGITEGNLMNKIETLATKGVDKDVVAGLHEARILGNWSLHEGLEFASDEVGDVAELLSDVVHELYVIPAQRQALKDARGQRRSSRVQDRDS